MRLDVILSSEDSITNLSLANAIIRWCDDLGRYELDPNIIAKAIMLEMEARTAAQFIRLNRPCNCIEKEDDTNG